MSAQTTPTVSDRIGFKLMPWLIFAVCLAITYSLWKSAQHSAEETLQTQFNYRVLDIVSETHKRMETYEQVMRGVDGLFAHAGAVGRDEFRDFVARLRLKENYPGIQSVRFVPIVPQAEKDRHIAAARKNGLPGYAIWPDGQRDIYAPVAYAEPYDERNKIAFGYDMLSDLEHPRPGDSGIGLRRAAAEQARDSGTAAISGKIRLVFETEMDRQAGFVMFLPVYKHDTPHGTVAERRANIIGWICSVFRMGDMMTGVLGVHGGDLDIDIYDGEKISEKTLMYESDNNNSTHDAAHDSTAQFKSMQLLDIAGHKWTMLLHSQESFEAQLDHEKPKIVVAIGIGASLLFTLLTWLLMRDRERAMQTSAAVARVSHKNEMLLRTASDGIYIFDLDGNVVQVNDAFCRMLGYTFRELLTMNVVQWNAQWPKEELIEKINALEASNPPFETLHRRRDGSIITVEVSASRVEIDGQQLIYNSARDITERKRTAMELEITYAENKWLQRFINTTPDITYFIGLDGRLQRWNAALEKFSGLSPDKIKGRSCLEFVCDQDRPVVEADIRKILANGSYANTYRFIRSDGALVSFHCNGTVVFNEHGEPDGFAGLGRDVSERLSIEEKLQKAMAAADAASRTKSDFLANMSHEIRTPMNAIIGLSHLCLQTELTPKQGDYLHKIHGSAKALLGLINDILDFSKIEAGKMEVEHVPFDLQDVMGNLATVISTKADEKGLEFLFETSLDVPPSLIGDSLRLGQVLINLAGNAVKFTEKGEVLVLTEVEEETADDVALRFTIRDSGIGMTREQIGKLFHAFTQADSTTTRKFGGTGLGLSISKRIVGLMDGKIWAESTPGKGSKFIFTARFQKVAERRAEKRYVPEGDLRGMRVLAVDDNATCRHILETYLKSFGFNATKADNGIEALHAIEQADREGAPYPFVILNWKMPGMDGIETAMKIHAMAGLSKIPKILLLSSFGQSEMLRRLDGKVVDGLLTKPFQQSELFDATLEIFGRAEAGKKKSTVTALFHPYLVAKISGAYLLLAEDNEINQQVARELLEKAGVTVAVVENGKEAVARVWEEKFDGVLMDMQMPVMDGISATREIRKNPRFAGLPIIAMTANVLAGDREQCLAAGMNDHITKPLDPNQMIATLAKWIVPAQPTAVPSTHNFATAQKPEALPDLPGVRVAEGVNRMGGNVAGYCAILERFRSGQKNTLAEIRSAIAVNDWEKTERLAHTLKGLLGTLGAEKLRGKAAELEVAIRGKAKVQVELLLPAIGSELAQFFAAIDRALQLRAAEKEMGAEITSTTGQVNIEELTNLIHQVKLQLEQYDSSVEDTVARIRQIVGGDAAMRQALAPIEKHVSGYDYERGLAELTACAKNMGISYDI